ncbi:hypothetical protein [Flavobacterium sp.]|uniref:hypothetical protein n=1 Tax=Flavobacterium sp. TaxID=239 RepID=UPI003F69E557
MKTVFKILIIITLTLFFSCKENKSNFVDNNENSNEILKDSFPTIINENKIEVECKCAENKFTGTKSDTIYNLSNGKSIALCGYRNTENKPVNFSEFVLSVCGQNEVIEFWNATETCNLKVNKDTLYVEELINLPTEKNRKYITTVWNINKIYFENEDVKKTNSLNKKIRKYSKEEILTTLKEYENADQELNEDKMVLVNRLFISIISKNNKAREYFYEFGDKYKLDGAFSEEYSDLKAMLKLWENQK